MMPAQIMQRLQENEDYQNLTRALNVLRYQLDTATRDIDTLVKMKDHALSDPFGFVNKIRNKTFKSPPLQQLPPIPLIRWEKYGYIAPLPTTVTSNSRKRKKGQDSRILSASSSSVAHAKFTEAVAQFKQQESHMTITSTGPRASSIDRSTECSDDGNPMIHEGVRGKSVRRLVQSQAYGEDSAGKSSKQNNNIEADETASIAESVGTTISTSTAAAAITTSNFIVPTVAPVDTYKRPWTDEEHKKLEELLEIYPEESVQAKRYQKISQALGTRTPRQVASHVQKYFIKLAQHGLPVPGRRPNVPNLTENMVYEAETVVNEPLEETPPPCKKRNTRVSGTHLNIGPSIPKEFREA